MQITAQREWRVVGDWRRIPWRYPILLSHKDWRDRMGKARWFCYTINRPSSAFSRAIDSPRFQIAAFRIPRWVAVSQSRFLLQTQIKHRPHVPRHKNNVPRHNVHVHILRRPEVPHRFRGYNPLQVVPLPQRRRARLLPLCGATLLSILTIRHRRAWRRRFRRFLVPRRAPRQRLPPLTAPLSLPANHRSRWLLPSNA